LKEVNTEFFRKLSLQEQFNWLVKTYSQDIYWVIRPIVKTHENTDDVLQNTFLKVYKHLPDFRYESKLFSWLYRIAVNESFDFLRKHKKYLQHVDTDLLQNLVADPYYEGDEIFFKLEKAISQLPPKQQEIFRLKYFNGLKFKEIAELTGTSVGGLKANYHLAVKKIKDYLTEN